MAAHRCAENLHLIKGKNKGKIRAGLRSFWLGELSHVCHPSNSLLCMNMISDPGKIEHFFTTEPLGFVPHVWLCDFFPPEISAAIQSHISQLSFNYNTIFQYSIKCSINVLEINSTNNIHFQMAYDNVSWIKKWDTISAFGSYCIIVTCAFTLKMLLLHLSAFLYSLVFLEYVIRSLQICEELKRNTRCGRPEKTHPSLKLQSSNCS